MLPTTYVVRVGPLKFTTSHQPLKSQSDIVKILILSLYKILVNCSPIFNISISTFTDGRSKQVEFELNFFYLGLVRLNFT
jgi:hypothetical protein